jgi:hypothetical protein
MGVLEVRMAKASADDCKRVVDFFEWLETFVDEGVDQSKPYDDEEDSYPAISEEEAMEHIKAEFSRWTRRATVAASWRRVVWGFSCLCDNVCDPSSDVLEWKPEIRSALEAMEDFEFTEIHPFAVDAFVTQ